MGKDFTLYWTNHARYENCPRQFLWYNGWGVIDLGQGPGRGKPFPVQRSKHDAVLGIVIQSVIEDLYNNELWRHPAGLQRELLERVEKTFHLQLAKPKNFIEWRFAPSREEMLETCRQGVLGYLRTMKQHRLLGPYARAEVDLIGWVDKFTPVGGRADMIIRRDDTGISILDGKNSKHKGKYTDPDQLRWYALCHFLAYSQMPDRLGFIYYRYPYGTPIEGSDQVEEGVEWVPCTREDIQGLAQRAIKVRKGLLKEKFDPNPTPKGCQFCDFETVCDARVAQRESNSRGRRKSQDLPDDGLLEIL